MPFPNTYDIKKCGPLRHNITEDNNNEGSPKNNCWGNGN